jgi:hypothetical protein
MLSNNYLHSAIVVNGLNGDAIELIFLILKKQVKTLLSANMPEIMDSKFMLIPVCNADMQDWDKVKLADSNHWRSEPNETYILANDSNEKVKNLCHIQHSPALPPKGLFWTRNAGLANS